MKSFVKFRLDSDFWIHLYQRFIKPYRAVTWGNPVKMRLKTHKININMGIQRCQSTITALA